MIATRERTIVLVEDNASEASVIREAIELEGESSWRLRVIRDGAKAAAAITAHPPDLVLLDLGLPGADGGTIYRNLRAQPQTHAIPVLFLTGATTHDLYDHGIDDGVLLRKPVDMNVLMQVVRTHLAQK